MRKNKLLISTLLPVAAFVTVVGAGYSAWYFQSNTTATTTAGIKVTPVAVGGGISVSSTDHGLTLDQIDGTLNTNPQGITWKTIKVKYTADTNEEAAAAGTGKIAWNVEVPGAFTTYVNITTSSGTFDITSLDTDQEFALDEAKLGLSYVDEPSNYAEWKAMHDALNTANITVTFTATYTFTEPSL